MDKLKKNEEAAFKKTAIQLSFILNKLCTELETIN